MMLPLTSIQVQAAHPAVLKSADRQFWRGVSGLDCEEVPGTGDASEIVIPAVVELEA
jgi:hypothetical protein